MQGASHALAFLHTDEGDPPVTVIRDIRVRPGAEGRFELLMGALIAEATRQPGHLGATIIRPHAPGEPYRFVYKFQHRSNLEAWHGSELRRQLFQPVLELVESDRFSEYPGLETWFDLPPHAAPPKWKTTLLSWGAIYVLVVAASYAMRAEGLNLPVPIGAFVLTAVVVPLVAYVVGPALGKLFRGWLESGSKS